MFKTYDLFKHRDINDVIPEIIYNYLFVGDSLTQIEANLFNTEEYRGWLSKSLLNYVGINTDGENKGIYKDKSINEVVKELALSKDISHIIVAKYLTHKYL